MKTFTVTYTIKFQLSFAPHYAWNQHNECYNLKTGRRIKQAMVGGSIGYVIEGKFKSLKSLRKHLIKPQKENLPF